MNIDVSIKFSDMTDGSMSKAVNDAERRLNRERFLAKLGVALDDSVLVHLKYEGDDYRRYHTVGPDQAGDGMIRASTMVSDALFTQTKGIALLLPVADCIGAVLYNPVEHVLGLAHLGRHNLVQEGGRGVIEYMSYHFSSQPSHIQVWLSPAAGKQSYPMHDFNGSGLHEVATAQLLAAGIALGHITVDNRDTTTESTLFSHSEFLKGTRATDGRQAVVAVLR